MTPDIHTGAVTIEAGEAPAHPLMLRRTAETLHVHVGEGARVSIVEEGCGLFTLHLAPRAVAEVISLGASGAGESASSATIEAEALCTWHVLALGGNIEHHVTNRIVGEGGVSNVNWIFALRGSERCAIAARNVFEAPRGGGEIVMKGVAEHRAHASAKGMIEIDFNGGGTNTYLTQNVLMLDPTAKVDVIPGLEIKTNDVKASHSATVTRVSPEDLFYFASRGIAAVEARRIYVEGFLGDLVARITNPEAQKPVQKALRGWMGGEKEEGIVETLLL